MALCRECGRPVMETLECALLHTTEEDVRRAHNDPDDPAFDFWQVGLAGAENRRARRLEQKKRG